ncbi:single-stranded DNA-binding protein [Staphylococcus cornubiensis]|uniref:single-stranded DNA-binding protein n=1 Tax=Staphylococcus cornubiensis TaxID=1986155 RepID=UPI000A384CA6|nr:single-stranded DNA-binding protein [Staphylococcus cornubiensis]
MNNINHFQAVGMINRPPSFYEKEESYFVTFTVAVTREYLSKNQKPITDYLNCKAFGNIALQIHETIHEGTTVAVSGQIQTRRFYHNEEKRYATELLVSQISPICTATAVSNSDAFNIE